MHGPSSNINDDQPVEGPRSREPGDDKVSWDGEPQLLDPRVTGLWRLQALLGLLTVFFPLLIVGAVLLATVIGFVSIVLAVLVALVVAVVQVGLWPALSYPRFRFALREEDLWITRGVLFRQQTVIPLSRIQHVDTRDGPLERILGLSRLMVYTASGLAPDGGIPGLERERAQALRDELARRGGGTDGL